MTPNTFLESLWRDGFTLEVEGDRLLVSPASRLTDEQRSLLTAHKAKLVRLVLAGRWDGVDLTALEPDWEAGPVQTVEGVVVDLWGRQIAISMDLAAILFSPSQKPPQGSLRLRKPCKGCKGKWGTIVRKNGQDTVWCTAC